MHYILVISKRVRYRAVDEGLVRSGIVTSSEGEEPLKAVWEMGWRLNNRWVFCRRLCGRLLVLWRGRVAEEGRGVSISRTIAL